MGEPPPPATVTLWWLAIADVPPERLPSRLLAILDETERRTAERFVSSRDAHAYRCAHLLRRALLGTVGRASAAHWRFAREGLGRPFVANPPTGTAWVVNLSHTDGMVAAVVADGCQVGVDLEAVERRGLSGDLAKRVCTPRELAALDGLADDRAAWRRSFLGTWVRKEAVAKATGLGLGLDLRSFGVGADTVMPETDVPEAIGSVADWLLEALDVGPEHLGCLAIHAPRRSVRIERRQLDAASLEEALTIGLKGTAPPA
ncbi:MAG: 4'-phosphopantetheinyl transferase superfamily protein [Pseudomonadota bacterium]